MCMETSIYVFLEIMGLNIEECVRKFVTSVNECKKCSHNTMMEHVARR